MTTARTISTSGANRRPRAAFTLIEMLVVISIIGIIASMVLGLGSLASRKKQDSVASAEISKLALMIDNYQSVLGYYPPDNFGTSKSHAGSPAYENYTSQNQLLYELTGATVISSNNTVFFQSFDGSVLLNTTLNNTFGRGGIANSNPDEPHCFYNPRPKPADYGPIGSTGLNGLIVPLPLAGNKSGANFVHYDSSSTNRHNSQSFDVWVEFDGGSSGTNSIIITNGNWHL